MNTMEMGFICKWKNIIGKINKRVYERKGKGLRKKRRAIKRRAGK